jgi:hypothetical protein
MNSPQAAPSLACRRAPVSRLVPLFLVSMAAVGFEIALTRYFAVVSWSEYGYWVISITMVGFAVSGIVISIFRNVLLRHAPVLLMAVPVLLMLAAAFGFHLTTLIGFNPLELQNRELWQDQIWNIGKYYAALFPFFFLAGLYIGLNFLRFEEDLGRVYGLDLAGAGAGALAILGLMFCTAPFDFAAFLLPVLALAAIWAASAPAAGLSRPHWGWVIAALVALLAGEGLLVMGNQAQFNEYKAIYAPMHTPQARVLAQVLAPQGWFVMLDDFTERLDTDFSNNAGLLQAASPPRTYGLYADGNRIASLPTGAAVDWTYTRATLDGVAYALRPAADVLLVGTAGGFRVKEAFSLGASSVLADEPERVLRNSILTGLGPSAPWAPDPRVRFTGASPLALAAGAQEHFDLVDLDSNFVAQADSHKYVLTTEAVAGLLKLAAPRGVVSLPVSIREFSVYAVKLIATVKAALEAQGIRQPGQHLIIYRSAWNARLLISPQPWSPAEIEKVRALCDERSFDVSYFPGIDPSGAKVYNDMPVVSFDESGAQGSGSGDDALMDEAVALLRGEDSAHHRFFDLRPATLDRPFFFATLPLGRLEAILAHIELVPREEIGSIINLAVLLQSVLLAALVLLLPAFKRNGPRPAATTLYRAILYFAALGLGFFFIEIYLIEKASLYLDDRSDAFALVLAGMLVFSGLGSMACARYYRTPERGLRMALAVIVLWLAAAWLGLPALLALTLQAPLGLRILLLLACLAPVSFALGFPFPLGLSQFRGPTDAFLPWAWSLNGAFSVIATPLASLIGISGGFRILLAFALFLYIVVAFCFPRQQLDKVSV